MRAKDRIIKFEQPSEATSPPCLECAWNDDPGRYFMPPIKVETVYPPGWTLDERIKFRKARIAENTIVINTPWGIRPA